MKLKLVYDMLKYVDIESDFIPEVGDYVSLLGYTDVPVEKSSKPLKVVRRSFSPFANSLAIILGEE